MMELRPIQVALLAGRSASRRATANPSTLSYPLIPCFYRSVSSTRPSFSEAEATAPPTPSMQEWDRQQQQRQQQQQKQSSEQPQRPAWGTSSGTNARSTAGSMASLLRPNNSTSLSSPTPSSTTPAPSEDSRRNPWAVPTNSAIRRSQANRIAAGDSNRPGIFDEITKDLFSGPTSEDLMHHPGLNAESASEIKYRLRPSIGRTVHIDKQKVDLARGLGLLNLRVRVNKVSQDVSRQRFHERPGLKRKRLRRERWRARFKDGFKATCKRVQDLARQGW